MWNHLREDCRGVKYLERGYIFWLWVWRGNRGLVRRPCLEVNVCNDRQQAEDWRRRSISETCWTHPPIHQTL